MHPETIISHHFDSNSFRVHSNHIFRDFVDATATIDLTEKEVIVQFQKRAHNPLLLAAGFDKECLPIPWLANRTLRLVFG